MIGYGLTDIKGILQREGYNQKTIDIVASALERFDIWERDTVDFFGTAVSEL